MRIVVIGPDPPCIRCETARKRAAAAAREFSENDLEIVSVFAYSPEADKIGKVESGHGIEIIGNVEPDRALMKRMLEELDILKTDEEANASQIDVCLTELDKAIWPVRQRAEELGYLMTPVVVVNDRVKSAGYTPAQEEIRGWIRSELPR